MTASTGTQTEPSATGHTPLELAPCRDEPGPLPPGHQGQAYLAALHELSERLTAITNYLASGLRLLEIDVSAAGIPPRHTEVLGKAFDQVNQADEVIKGFRKLLVKESEMQGDREKPTRERAYALWDQDGRPNGKDLEHWLGAEAELSGETHADVTNDGKIAGRAQTELRKSPTSE